MGQQTQHDTMPMVSATTEPTASSLQVVIAVVSKTAMP